MQDKGYNVHIRCRETGMENQDFERPGAGRDEIFLELTPLPDPITEAPHESEEQGRDRRVTPPPQAPSAFSPTEFTIFERLDYLWRTHTYITGNFRLADAKAAVTIVFATSLIGTQYAARLHHSFARQPLAVWGAPGWLSVLSFLSLGISVLLAAWSVYPRLWNTQKIDYIYWENILSHSSGKAYWEFFHKDSAEELEQGLCNNIYTLASLCQRKYRCLRTASWIALFGGVVSVALLVFWNPEQLHLK